MAKPKTTKTPMSQFEKSALDRDMKGVPEGSKKDRALDKKQSTAKVKRK